MKTRTYKLYKETELKVIEAAICDVLSQWSTSWMNSSNVITLNRLRPIHGDRKNINAETIYKAVDNKGRSVHFLFDNPVIGGLCKLLFGGDLKNETVNCYKDGIANDVIKSALKNLAELIFFSQERVGDTEFIEQNSLPKEIFSPGFGSVLMELSFNDEDLLLICSKEALEGLFAQSGKITQPKPIGGLDSVKSAISKYSVKCKAKLGVAEISCADLVSLQVGDVIQLEQKLEEPVALVFDSDQVGCKGFLGKQDVSMAIKVRAG